MSEVRRYNIFAPKDSLWGLNADEAGSYVYYREHEAALSQALARIAQLEGLARNLIDEADLTCMRANEEISVAEGCPCPVCVLRAALAHDKGEM